MTAGWGEIEVLMDISPPRRLALVQSALNYAWRCVSMTIEGYHLEYIFFCYMYAV